VTSTRTGSFAIAGCSRTRTKHKKKKKKKKTQQQKYQSKVLRIRSILCATNEESSRLLWASKYHEEEEEETKMDRGPRTLMECRKEHIGKMPLWKPLLQSLLCRRSVERLAQKMMMCEVFPSAFVLTILR
jgi:hypothetical protein